MNILPAQKILDHFARQISTLRSGRINSTILDTLKIEAYGGLCTIKEVATVTMPEPRQLLITPFDKGLIKYIAKSIENANLGVVPQDDGAGIRLNFPAMTEDLKKKIVKDLGKMLEENGKIPLREIRQKLLKEEKALKEEGLISEDELKRFEVELQKEVKECEQLLENMVKDKENDIMKV